MQLGDEVLFYHSNADPLAIVGVTRRRSPGLSRPDGLGSGRTIISTPKLRPTIRFGTWSICGLKEIFPTPLPLDRLREEPRLAKMELLRRGSRLSVQPVNRSRIQGDRRNGSRDDASRGVDGDTANKRTSPARATVRANPKRRRRETSLSIMHDPLAWLDDELARLDAQGLRRRIVTRLGPQGATIRVRIRRRFPADLLADPAAGRELINFGSNDYLGLAADPRLAAAATWLPAKKAGAPGPVRW